MLTVNSKNSSFDFSEGLLLDRFWSVPSAGALECFEIAVQGSKMQCHHAPLTRRLLRAWKQMLEQQPDPTSQMRFSDSWGSTSLPSLRLSCFHPVTSLSPEPARWQTVGWLRPDIRRTQHPFNTSAVSQTAVEPSDVFREKDEDFSQADCYLLCHRGAEGQGFSPHPCGSAAQPLDITSGLRQKNDLWWH